MIMWTLMDHSQKLSRLCRCHNASRSDQVWWACKASSLATGSLEIVRIENLWWKLKFKLRFISRTNRGYSELGSLRDFVAQRMSELLLAQLHGIRRTNLMRSRNPRVDVSRRLRSGAGGVQEGQKAARGHRQQRVRVVRDDGRAGDLYARRWLPRLYCANNKRKLASNFLKFHFLWCRLRHSDNKDAFSLIACRLLLSDEESRPLCVLVMFAFVSFNRSMTMANNAKRCRLEFTELSRTNKNIHERLFFHYHIRQATTSSEANEIKLNSNANLEWKFLFVSFRLRFEQSSLI